MIYSDLIVQNLHLKMPPFCSALPLARWDKEKSLLSKKTEHHYSFHNCILMLKRKNNELTVTQSKQSCVIDCKNTKNKIKKIRHDRKEIQNMLYLDKNMTKTKQEKNICVRPCLVILPSSWLHSSSTCSLRSRMVSRTGSKEASGLTFTGGRSPDSRGLHMDSYVWRKIWPF